MGEFCKISKSSAPSWYGYGDVYLNVIFGRNPCGTPHKRKACEDACGYWRETCGKTFCCKEKASLACVNCIYKKMFCCARKRLLLLACMSAQNGCVDWTCEKMLCRIPHKRKASRAYECANASSNWTCEQILCSRPRKRKASPDCGCGNGWSISRFRREFFPAHFTNKVFLNPLSVFNGLL